MKLKKRITFIFIVVGLLTFTSISFSQTGVGKGRLKVTVLLEDNRPVKGANLEIQLVGSIKRGKGKPQIIPIEDGRTFKAVTKKSGFVIFSTLGYGYWKVTATYKDFTPATRSLEVLTMGRNKDIELVLKKSQKIVAKDKLKTDIKSIDEGINLLKEKKYDQAFLSFQSYFKKHPKIYQVHFFLGKCLKEKGEYERAIDEYNLLIDNAKDDQKGTDIMAKALAGIGEVYIKKNDLKKGQEYFMKSIKLSPKDEILAYNVGEIYFGNNNSDGAITYYKKAAEIKPKWPVPYLKLGYAFLNKGDIKSAIENFKIFLKLDPKSPEADGIKAVIESLKGTK